MKNILFFFLLMTTIGCSTSKEWILLQGQHPHDTAQKLADAGIYVWDGNYYALNVTERLDLEDKGGMVRVGGAHYNTLDEVARLGDVLQKIAK